MITVEEALSTILSAFNPLPSSRMSILNTLGQVVAENITSKIDVPSFKNSAMDGYAINSNSCTKSSSQTPTILSVLETVGAGETPKDNVSPTTAIRIMTGAPIPNGADAVVPFENTNETELLSKNLPLKTIKIFKKVDSGQYIRPAGEDISSGQLIVSKGTVVTPPIIGLLSSIGVKSISVTKKPIVAIISTGSELIESGSNLSESKIYDSNQLAISAYVKSCGGIPKQLGIAQDDIKDISAKIKQGLTADMIITSAGVSKGEYDLVKKVLSDFGDIHFWSVRMKPAKPLAFGIINRKNQLPVPLLGLPGNPVSALIGFHKFGKPAIYKMMNKSVATKQNIVAILEDKIINKDNRRIFARVLVYKKNNQYFAKLAGGQGSNLMSTVVNANGLATCPETSSHMVPGEKISVEIFDWAEIR